MEHNKIDNEEINVKNTESYGDEKNSVETEVPNSGLAVFNYFISFCFMAVGFYKMYVYSNPEYGNPVNAFVGGDAYNYIINGTHATAFFVLALVFAVFGGTASITNVLKHKLK